MNRRRGETDQRPSTRFRKYRLQINAPPSRPTAWVLVRRASRAFLLGQHDRALELALQARAQAEQLGWTEGLSEALNLLGMARLQMGDRDGIEDIERSIELAAATDALGVLTRAHNSLAVAHQILGEPGLGYQSRLRAAEMAERVGAQSLIRWFQGVLTDHRYRRGEWDEAQRTAAAPVTERRPRGHPRWLRIHQRSCAELR